MLDLKDLVYATGGIALLGLTSLPLVCGRRVVSVPTIYVTVGAALVLLPLGWPVIDPMATELSLKVVEHATEVIVIVALAAAGLAIDRPMGPRRWRQAWVLLGITMPLTIVALALLGLWAGLGLASALLLGAALAPTDPVLAREVAVGGPTQGEEDDVRLALTAESGLNDGLAFPFVWLAIVAAQAGGVLGVDELGTWLARDVLWRIAAGTVVGCACGWLTARFVLGPWGDARLGGSNAGLVFLGTTFLAYGMAEAVDGYGFLAVFLAALVGRAVERGTDHVGYAVEPHEFGEQVEKVLLAALLIWLGGFAASGLLAGLTWAEVAIALLLIFVVRPLAGWVALICTQNSPFERLTISFFGIRGLGSVFYVSYAAAHASFGDIEAVWRITVLVVLVSILVHGALAPIVMARLPSARQNRTTGADDAPSAAE